MTAEGAQRDAMKRRTFLAMAAAPAALALTSCSTGTATPGPSGLGSSLLPRPAIEGPTLAAVLARRRSVREYAEAGVLTAQEVSQLLWAAQGVTSPQGFRTAPSAGALYPLTLYVVDPEGLHRYDADRHALELLSRTDSRAALSEAAMGQEPVRAAPMVFVLAGNPSVTARKYGTRADRFVFLEAGHAAQNLLLAATALGLGGVSIGSFDDDAVHELLDLPGEQQVVYLVPVGRPR